MASEFWICLGSRGRSGMSSDPQLVFLQCHPPVRGPLGHSPTRGLMCLKSTHHCTAQKDNAPLEISASLGRPSGHGHPALAQAHNHPRGAPVFSQNYRLHLVCALWFHQSQTNFTPHPGTESDLAPAGNTDAAHSGLSWESLNYEDLPSCWLLRLLSSRVLGGVQGISLKAGTVPGRPHCHL